MKRKILLILFFQLSVYFLIAQNLYYKHFTKSEGLPSNQIFHIFQDSKGYLWFATDYGVSKFDGVSFTTYTDNLPDNTVFEIYEDSLNRIWFVSFSCQLSYLQNDSIHPYKFNYVLKENLHTKGFSINSTFDVDKQDNIVLATYHDGLLSITNKGEFSKIECSTSNYGYNFKFKDNKCIPYFCCENWGYRADRTVNIVTKDKHIKFLPKLSFVNFTGLYTGIQVSENHFLVAGGGLMHEVLDDSLSNSVILKEKIIDFLKAQMKKYILVPTTQVFNHTQMANLNP